MKAILQFFFCAIFILCTRSIHASDALQSEIDWKPENIYTIQNDPTHDSAKIIQISCLKPTNENILATYLTYDQAGNYVIVGLKGTELDQLKLIKIKQPYPFQSENQLAETLQCFQIATSYLSSYGRCYPFFQSFNTVFALSPDSKISSKTLKLSIKELSLQQVEPYVISVLSISNTKRNGKLIIAYTRSSTKHSKETTTCLGILNPNTGIISEFYASSSLLSTTQAFKTSSLQWISNDYILVVSPAKKVGICYRVYSLHGETGRELSCTNPLLIYQNKLYEVVIKGEQVKPLLLFDPPQYHYDETFQSFFVNP